RSGQVIGVEDGEDARDDEPVRRHVHGNAERPGHDESLPAAGLIAPVRLLLLATCHITDATCIRRPRASPRPAVRLFAAGSQQPGGALAGTAGRAGPPLAEIKQNVGGLPYGCGVDIENAVDDLDAGASFGVAGDPPSALSPSRASDFMTCPLLYRFRVIDRIPEPP